MQSQSSMTTGERPAPFFSDALVMCGRLLRVKVLLDVFRRGIGSGHVSGLDCSRDGPLASMKFAVREPDQTGALEAL
jgi:hypothetical protein